SSRRRHTRSKRDWSSDVCSSDLADETVYLTWYDVFAGGGALFRSVSGEASGDVAPGAQVVRNARVDVELRDPTTATVEVSAMWRSEERRVGKEWSCRGGPGA